LRPAPEDPRTTTTLVTWSAVRVVVVAVMSAICRHALLVAVDGQCCREWVCPHSLYRAGASLWRVTSSGRVPTRYTAPVLPSGESSRVGVSTLATPRRCFPLVSPVEWACPHPLHRADSSLWRITLSGPVHTRYTAPVLPSGESR